MLKTMQAQQPVVVLQQETSPSSLTARPLPKPPPAPAVPPGRVPPAGEVAPVSEHGLTPAPKPGISRFNVWLSDPGNKKIQVIKIVRQATGLPLKDAKWVVDNAPEPVLQDIPDEDAVSLVRALVAAGATADMTQSASSAAEIGEEHVPVRDEADEGEPIFRGGVAEELEHLAALHGRPLLTDAEFAAAKAKVLDA
jgi:large subunit ribosomal protein L7/L12